MMRLSKFMALCPVLYLGCIGDVAMDFRLSFPMGDDSAMASVAKVENDKLYAILGKIYYPSGHSPTDPSNETRSRCLMTSTVRGQLSAPGATLGTGLCVTSASCALAVAPNRDNYLTLHYVLPATNSANQPSDRDIIDLQLFDSQSCPPASTEGSLKRTSLFFTIGQPPKKVDDL